jgi:hypothetical protein
VVEKDFISFISRGKLLILVQDSKPILATARGTLDGSLSFPGAGPVKAD